MPYKAYLLLLERPDKKNKLKPAELTEVKRILGDQTCPLFAGETAFGIGFISTVAAMTMLEKVRPAVGEQTRISVFELGRDQAQFGLPHHHNWLAMLNWMSQQPASD